MELILDIKPISVANIEETNFSILLFMLFCFSIGKIYFSISEIFTQLSFSSTCGSQVIFSAKPAVQFAQSFYHMPVT